ncbi:peptidase U32 family protein [Lachnoclostridium sp. Marseille-P6806]|uniref:peptidase U32 family protein n=1 Tax=Lachnoclostridium sp. Marseille-P6806 TaxID=2364793 RepID=UPI0010309E20|nr:U32 family peptidase [Lachnoclostridium sp. Marseille-P6806]
MEHRAELLAPAGNYDAFRGAVNAGADAVYLAGRRFGARAYADNFSDEELRQCLREAHLSGVRVHLTVNTLTRERELGELIPFLAPLCEDGLDGVIVQDIGVMKVLHEAFPDLPIHASTQLSVTTADAVRFLVRLGVTRVVPARELSLSEVRALREELPVETETFVHGAMCYCYSGKCLFSSFLGGRSGNRGRCAQTCRLPYRILDEKGIPAGPDAGKREYYPLSMRDMCILEYLPELIEAGIDSFKIEGRMKRPEYAAGVTALYRKYMDLYYRLRERGDASSWRVAPEDMEELKALYLRTDLCGGYYHRSNGREMVTISAPGYRGADEALIRRLGEQYVRPIRRTKVAELITLEAGKPAALRLRLGGENPPCALTGDVLAEGDLVQLAEKRPLSEEDIRRSLGKTGDTVFAAERIEIRRSGEVFLPVRSLNELRRTAFERLSGELEACWKRDGAARLAGRRRLLAADGAGKTVSPKRPQQESAGGASENLSVRLLAVVISRAQAEGARAGGADATADDSQSFLLSGTAELLAFPYVVRRRDAAWMDEALRRLLSGEYRGALIRSLEALEFLRFRGYHGPVFADTPVCGWNRAAMEVIGENADHCILPLELSGRELRESFPEGRHYAAVYGRVPMMITAGCVRKTEKSCRLEENGFWALEDRKKQTFPVRTVCTHCQNIIYNSVPLSLHKAFGAPLLSGCRGFVMSFTTEDGRETQRITRSFRRMADGEREVAVPFAAFTGGHFRKGVE